MFGVVSCNFVAARHPFKNGCRGAHKARVFATGTISSFFKTNIPNPLIDEDITMSTTTPAAPPHQAPLPSLAGPITRARARDLDFVMLLKNEDPEE
jgi:hypothetical protein